MLTMIHRVNNVPMMSVSVNCGWQWVGLTLSYPYQGK